MPAGITDRDENPSIGGYTAEPPLLKTKISNRDEPYQHVLKGNVVEVSK
jgi:hypothetical protein